MEINSLYILFGYSYYLSIAMRYFKLISLNMNFNFYFFTLTTDT